MREQRSQKSIHPGRGILCRCALEQVVGAQHYKKNIHRCVFCEQPKRIRIPRNLTAIGTGIDTFVAGLLCQQVNPAVIGNITVTKETSGIIAVGIGISETQYPHRNHLRWFYYNTGYKSLQLEKAGSYDRRNEAGDCGRERKKPLISKAKHKTADIM